MSTTDTDERFRQIDRDSLRLQIANAKHAIYSRGYMPTIALSVEQAEHLLDVEARQRTGTWEPPETAPKDESEFLGLFVGRGRPRVIRIGRWIAEFATFGWDGTDGILLAWQPLPAAPALPERTPEP